MAVGSKPLCVLNDNLILIGDDMEKELEELKAIAIRITRAVCDVNGTITKQEINRLDFLTDKYGKDYDAVNCVWHTI